MPTPQRVRDEAREAETRIQALQNGNEPPSDPPSDPASDVARDPAVARQADSQFGVGQVVEPVTPNDGGDGGGGGDGGSGPITGEAYAALQRRLAALEGTFNRVNTDLQAERARAQTLERMLERRMEEPPAAPAPAAPAVPRSSVTDQEVEEFGADLTDFIRRLVTDGVTPVLDRLQRFESSLTELRNVATHTATTAQTTVAHQFAQRMNELVRDADGNPDWEHINHMHESGDTRFVDWLQKIGEDSDEPRLGIIQRAYQRGDADRCARMINRFKQDVGLPDGNARPAAASSPAAPPAAALVSPPASGASSTPGRGRPAQKTYTVADVNRHYDEKAKGKWRGREAEWRKIADDMDRAVAEERFVDPTRRR